MNRLGSETDIVKHALNASLAASAEQRDERSYAAQYARSGWNNANTSTSISVDLQAAPSAHPLMRRVVRAASRLLGDEGPKAEEASPRSPLHQSGWKPAAVKHNTLSHSHLCSMLVWVVGLVWALHFINMNPEVFRSMFSYGGPMGGGGVLSGLYKESSVFALMRGVGQPHLTNRTVHELAVHTRARIRFERGMEEEDMGAKGEGDDTEADIDVEAEDNVEESIDDRSPASESQDNKRGSKRDSVKEGRKDGLGRRSGKGRH